MMDFGFPARHERGGVIMLKWPLPARAPRDRNALLWGRCAPRIDEEQRGAVGSGSLPIPAFAEGADRSASRRRLDFCGRMPVG